MIERIVDVSESGVHVRVKDEQLVLERERTPIWSAPLFEVAALVVSNPGATLTHRALAGLATNGAAVVVCDTKHLPVGMLLPLAANYVQAERFQLQARAGLPLKKQLWRQIVKAKISAQGRLLSELRGRDFGLGAMSKKVRSGDPDNLEGMAAKRYWPQLFADKNFRRVRDAPDQNRFLNYGYAVLRALVARGICGAGLHPSLGVHHHNRYDAFCLADDLMEPFRPVVDLAAASIVADRGGETAMDPETKAALLEPLMGKFQIDGEERTLFDISARLAVSLAHAFAGKAKSLAIPQV